MVALGGVHGFIQGGMHGFIWGACVVLFGGHAWFYLGGHAWFYLGEVCVVLFGGHVWFYLGGMRGFFSFFGYNEIRSMSGRYASYWNAFLFHIFLVSAGRIYAGKIVKSAVSTKCPDVIWNEDAYSISATSRGKEIRLTLAAINPEELHNDGKDKLSNNMMTKKKKPSAKGFDWQDFKYFVQIWNVWKI